MEFEEQPVIVKSLMPSCQGEFYKKEDVVVIPGIQQSGGSRCIAR